MLNKAIVQGRMAKDPELRTSSGGQVWTSFSVACQRNFKDGSGNRETDFISVIAWRQTAEFIGRYFKKGDLIIIDGAIQCRNYTDNNGVKHYVTEILADQVNFCGKSESAGGSPASAPQSAPPSVPQTLNDDSDEDDEDDDGKLPF